MSPQDATINLDTERGGTATRGNSRIVDYVPCGSIRVLTRIRPIGDGGVCIYAADLAGLVVQADSIEDAMRDFGVVAKAMLEEYAAAGDGVPWGSVEREDGDQDGPQVLIDV